MAAGVKILSDGKVSLPIKNKNIKELIASMILCRLIDEENDIIATLLREIREKLDTDKGRIKLTKSQFTAIIDRETLRHLHPSEQIYLAAVLNPEFKVIK